MNENNFTKEKTHYIISTVGDYIYRAYTNKNSELLFAIENPEKPSNTKNIACKFIPSDADHLIKGLFYQSAKGLGRTSANTLIKILEYKFSEQFLRDLEENKKY